MLQYPEFGGCDGDPYKSLNNLLQCINTVLRRGKQMCREIKNEWERGGGEWTCTCGKKWWDRKTMFNDYLQSTNQPRIDM
jgi:hypothetical protein